MLNAIIRVRSSIAPILKTNWSSRKEIAMDEDMTGAIKRPECAGLDMVLAYFQDHFIVSGVSDERTFELTHQLATPLLKCQKDGYIVILRHDSACPHCGARWPRDDGEPHLRWCKTCQEERQKHLPPPLEADDA